MPRGFPDYGIAPNVAAVTNIDTTDVTATNIGYGRLDGKGRIAFIDNFDNGLNGWELFTVGTGVLPVHKYVSGRGALNGSHIAMETPHINDESGFYRRMILPNAKRVGVEILCRQGTNSGGFEVIIDRQPIDGFNLRARLLFDVNGQRFAVYTNGGWLHVSPFYDLGIDETVLLQAKIVIDFENKDYHRFICGGYVFELDGYPLFTPAVGAEAWDRVMIKGVNPGWDIANTFYLNSVIITVDEP